MTKIRRWACVCGSGSSHFIPDKIGGWVPFEDHNKAVADNGRLRAMLAEARAELELAALRTGAPFDLLRNM
jgi:hypothetical protein